MTRTMLASALGLTALWSTGCGGSGEAGPPTHFDVLTLVSTGSDLPSDTSICDITTFPQTLVVTRATSHLSWDLCELVPIAVSGQTVHLTGDRALTSTELAGVESALSNVVPVHEPNNCGFDVPLLVLDVQAYGRLDKYVDDYYAGCLPPAAATRTVVSNLGDLEGFVGGLVAAP